MSYTIDFINADNFLHILVQGKESYANSLEYSQTIIRHCETTGERNILLEEKLKGELSVFEIYRISTYLIKILFSKNLILNIAYLDETQAHTIKNYFAENVFVNRGVNVKFFRVYNDAEKWLTAQ